MAKNKHNIFIKACEKYFVVLLNNVVVRVEKSFSFWPCWTCWNMRIVAYTKTSCLLEAMCLLMLLVSSVSTSTTSSGKRRIYTVLEMGKFILYPCECLILSIFLIELVQSFKKEVCLSLVYFCPYFVISFDLWIIRIWHSRS